MLPEIVRRALLTTVVDLGQLTGSEKRALQAAVRKGHLAQGKGGGYPALKTVYAHPGFDFKADREAQLRALRVFPRSTPT